MDMIALHPKVIRLREADDAIGRGNFEAALGCAAHLKLAGSRQ
jgi:hypothetical protein